MAVYLNPCKLRIVGMTNHTHNKYKTVMERMLRHKDTFPWERLFSHHFPQAEQAVKASMTRESMKVVIDPWMESGSDLLSAAGWRFIVLGCSPIISRAVSGFALRQPDGFNPKEGGVSPAPANLL